MRGLLLFILLSTLFYSCERSWYYEYVIENSTNHEVTIYAFDTDKGSTVNNETIEIPSKGRYSVLKGNGFDGDYQGVFNTEEIDSVVICFDNSKLLIQSCTHSIGTSCEFDRNIMNYNNESDFIKTKRGKSQGHEEYRFTYTITEEDYNNAVPIE